MFVGTVLKVIRKILAIAVAIIGVLAILKIVANKLEEKGIIKREWIIERRPSGKGVRYAMSILDKAIISFQL